MQLTESEAAWDCWQVSASASEGRGDSWTRSKSDWALSESASWRSSAADNVKVTQTASSQAFIPLEAQARLPLY